MYLYRCYSQTIYHVNLPKTQAGVKKLQPSLLVESGKKKLMTSNHTEIQQSLQKWLCSEKIYIMFDICIWCQKTNRKKNNKKEYKHTPHNLECGLHRLRTNQSCNLSFVSILLHGVTRFASLGWARCTEHEFCVESANLPASPLPMCDSLSGSECSGRSDCTAPPSDQREITVSKATSRLV